MSTVLAVEEIFDLPAHPLLVHIPIVLTPVLAVAVVAITARPAWRVRYGWPLVAATGVVMIVTVLAAQAGDQLDEYVRDSTDTSKHRDLGELARTLTIAMFVAVLGFVATAHWLSRRSAGDGSGDALVKRVPLALGALASVVAVLATVWIIRAGHEGARITWTGVIPE